MAVDWAREIEMSHTNGQSIYPDGRHPMVVNRMEQYVNNLTSIRRLLERTSDPRRDIDAECGFPKDGNLTADYFRGKYDRDAIANRVVQLLPKETWQVQPRIYESENTEVATPFEEAWDALARNLRGRSWYKDEAGSPVWEVLKRADILSGIGHYGIILIGIDDGKQLHEPVDGVQVDSYADQINYPRGTDAQYTTPFGGRVEYPDSKLADSDPKVGAKGKTIKVEDQYGKPKITKPGKGLTGNAFGKPRDENVEESDGKVPPFGKKESGLPDRGEEGLDNSEVAKDRFGLSPEAGGRGEQFEELDRTGDPEFPDEEVKPFKPKHRLTFLRAYDETLAQITQWDSDPSSPRFGHPLMYNVNLFDPRNQQTGVGLTMQTQQVHWTRVIHLADNLDCSDTFGVPRLKAVLNNILGLQKVYGGDPEAFWKNMMMRLFLETHPQLGPDVDIHLNAVKDVMENMENGLQRWATLTGMAAKTVAPSVVDPTSHINAQIEAICILLGCPVRIFKGSERGELASSQDDSAWNDRLRERQLNYLSPRVIIPFVDRLIQMGVLPEPSKEDVEEKAKQMAEELPKDEEGLGGFVAEDPITNCYLVFNADKEVEAIVPKGGYSIEWPDLDSLGRQAKAQIAQTRVAAMSQYVSGQVGSLMAPMDFLTRELNFEEEEAEVILQNATDHQDEVAQQQMEQQGAAGGFPGQQPPPFGEGGEEGLPPGQDPNDPFGGQDPSTFDVDGDGELSDEELDKILNNVSRGWPPSPGTGRWEPIANKLRVTPSKDTGKLRPSVIMRGVDRRLTRVNNAEVENSNPEGYNQYKHRGIVGDDPFFDPEKLFGHKVEYPKMSARDRRDLEEEARDPRPGRTLVDVSSLIPTQEMTGVDKASRIADEYDDGKAAVTVYGRDGKHYIYDGHHTVAAAILAGRKQIRVNYVGASPSRRKAPPTANSDDEVMVPEPDPLEEFSRIVNAEKKPGDNCGTGAGGFKKGNSCASDPSRAAMEKDLLKTVSGWGRTNPMPLPELFDKVKAKHPDLTLGKFQDSLRELWDKRHVELLPYTRAYADIAGERTSVFLDGEVRHHAYSTDKGNAVASEPDVEHATTKTFGKDLVGKAESRVASVSAKVAVAKTKFETLKDELKAAKVDLASLKAEIKKQTRKTPSGETKADKIAKDVAVKITSLADEWVGYARSEGNRQPSWGTPAYDKWLRRKSKVPSLEEMTGRIEAAIGKASYIKVAKHLGIVQKLNAKKAKEYVLDRTIGRVGTMQRNYI